MFTPSPQQSSIFSSALTSSSNLVIEAVAGSGKTTTLVELLKLLVARPSPSFLPPSFMFLSFSKQVVETLVTRVPRGVSCATFNALGLRALKNSRLVPANVKIDGRKIHRLITNAVGYDHPDSQNLAKLVSLGKSLVASAGAAGTSLEIATLVSRYELDFSDEKAAVQVAQAVLKASAKDLTTLDFDDMLALPILYNASFDQQDWVFVDEAQDTNDIQVEILKRVSKTTTKLVIVGDSFQAIYGFRGANSNAMDKISKEFTCKTLPLSVSYRCAKAIVAEARKCLQQYEEGF